MKFYNVTFILLLFLFCFFFLFSDKGQIGIEIVLIQSTLAHQLSNQLSKNIISNSIMTLISKATRNLMGVKVQKQKCFDKKVKKKTKLQERVYQ